jgi:hypothetical protein
MSFELCNSKMLIFFIRKIVYIFGVEKYLKTAVPEKPKKSRSEIIFMRKTLIILGLIFLAMVVTNAQESIKKDYKADLIKDAYIRIDGPDKEFAAMLYAEEVSIIFKDSINRAIHIGLFTLNKIEIDSLTKSFRNLLENNIRKKQIVTQITSEVVNVYLMEFNFIIISRDIENSISDAIDSVLASYNPVNADSQKFKVFLEKVLRKQLNPNQTE